MKNKKRLLQALALTFTLACGICIGANASGDLQAITAYLNPNITVTLDGTPKDILDASGNRTYPITYNGTTYVPIRSLSNLLGLEVNWDQATQTVLLGKSTAGVDLIDTFKPYTQYRAGYIGKYTANSVVGFCQTADKKTTSFGGVDLDHWLCMWSGYANKDRTNQASFNLLGKYNSLTFQAYSEGDTTLTVYGDNESVLAQYNLKGGQTPQTFTVNLMQTSQLTFHCNVVADQVNKDGSVVGIFNAVLSE